MKHDPDYAATLYGATVEEYLRRWDGGVAVWTVEMGGLGPGYEQALQIAMMEVLRHFQQLAPNVEELYADPEKSKAFLDTVWEWGMTNEVIKNLGLSGAQWSAAVNLALFLYRKGPAEALNSDVFQDRKIQVSRKFPRADGQWA